ncbi:MAG: GLUG motif-containing protein, partial [Planctomycetota bacterium]
MKWLNGYKIRFVLVGFIAVIVFSPCIDAGDPSNSVAFESYPNGGTVEASQSPSGLHSKYGGGTGVPNDPYLIYAAEHLNALGAEPSDYDKHFKLMADIDLSGYTYDKAVIAPDLNDDKDSLQGTTFTGVFDGNGHTISHLTIEGGGFLGLFGQIGLSGRHESGATVSNLGLEAVDVSGKGDHVGGLVGLMNHEDGSIINCYSTGMVTGGEYVGGLVGSSKRGGRITASYSTGTVTGDKFVGGLVGCNGSSVMFQGTLRTPPSRVAACFSNSTVTGGECVGGLVGVNYETGSIANSYSTGVVSGDDNVGGLVGGDDVPQIFVVFVGGGDSALVTHCVWDMETSGQTASAAGAGLTTGEMMDSYMLGLNGFANDPNWVLDDGHDYPRLAWEGTPGQIIPKPEIDWLGGQGTAEIPYRIDTADQLIFLGQAASALWDKHFVLAADIDLNPNLPGREVFSRAVFQAFWGVFDGNDHTISHLTISGDSYLGLFGQLGTGAIISNLGLEAADIKGTGSRVGNLAGRNRGSITDCFSSALVSGNQLVGGLVGENYGEGSITSCYSTGAVTGDKYVGGLVGRNGFSSGLPWMPLATATRVAN